MQSSTPDSGEDFARNWRAMARRQRWVNLGITVLVFALLWVLDYGEPGEGMLSLANWPMVMPVVLIFGSTLVTGRQVRGGGTYYLLAGYLAGDRSVVERYPPVVQAALLRATEAGADRSSLLPLTHRLLWRLGLPVPPVAFSPAWLDALILFATMYAVVPLWLQVQLWWNPGFGGETLRVSAGVLTVLFAMFAVLLAAHRASERRRLGLPTWREFRRDWARDSAR